MIKRMLAALLAFLAMSVFAAVDVNKGSSAELDAVKGIGPVIAGRIVAERAKAPFKDWADLIARVNGIGEKTAAKFSEGGLTVNGAAFSGAPAVTAPAKTSAKAAAPAPAPAPVPAPVAAAAPTAPATTALPAAPAASNAKADAKAKKKADAEAKAASAAKK